MALFLAGWIGCAITIPLAGYKYMSVVFERDAEDRPGEAAADD